VNGWHRPALRGVLHGIVALASLGVLFLLASRDGRLWFVGTPEILGGIQQYPKAWWVWLLFTFPNSSIMLLGSSLQMEFQDICGCFSTSYDPSTHQNSIVFSILMHQLAPLPEAFRPFSRLWLCHPHWTATQTLAALYSVVGCETAESFGRDWRIGVSIW